MNYEEVADLTKIPVNTIKKFATKKRIPCVRIGRLIRFDPADLAAWIEGSKVRPEGNGRE